MHLATLMCLWTLAGSPADNPVLAELLDQGVPVAVSSTNRVKLPPPSMTDGLDAAAQRRVLEQVAGKTRKVEDLLHNAAVAPFVLKTDDLPAKDGEPMRHVGVWYVAYGELDAMFTDQFVERMLEMAPAEKKSRLPLRHGNLSDEELRPRNLQVQAGPDRKEQYSFGTYGLFDRVLINATRHIVATRQSESIVIAAITDPRFNDDETYPNTWRSLKMDTRGDYTFGEPKVYDSSGSLTKITRLKEPAGALFIEHHHVFAEPQGWFEGKNLLRSKLPMAVQESVRQTRWQLRAAKQP